MPGRSTPAAPGTSEGADGPRVGLIWAQARGGVIGDAGSMPWDLPEDLKHFSRTTKGSPVVMGRRTWYSFPPKYRPLPGRTNIVITRDDDFADEGAVRARDLPEGLRLAREVLVERAPGGSAGSGDSGDSGGSAGSTTSAASPTPDAPTLWVIGGGAVYREAIDDADLLAITEIDLEVEGDTTAPAIPSAFSLASADPESGWHEAANGLRYRMLTYAR